MRTVVISTLLLMVNLAQAQIFKCETGTGKVIYQDEECANSSKQMEVVIKEIDPEKARKAQEKLSKDLLQQEDLESIKSIKTLK